MTYERRLILTYRLGIAAFVIINTWLVFRFHPLWGDLDIFRGWGIDVLAGRMADLYNAKARAMDHYVYPVVGVYITAPIVWAIDRLGLAWHSFGAGLVFKAFPVGIFFASGILCRRILKTLGYSERTAVFCSLAYCLNPAMWIVTSVYGQWDVMIVAAILVSLYALTTSRPWASGCVLALIVLVKPFVIFCLPVMAYIIWRRAGNRGSCLAMVAGVVTVVVAHVPYMLMGGSIGDAAKSLVAAPNVYRIPYISSCNLWYMADWITNGGKPIGRAITSGLLLQLAVSKPLMFLIWACLCAAILSRVRTAATVGGFQVFGLALFFLGAFLLFPAMQSRYVAVASGMLSLVGLNGWLLRGVAALAALLAAWNIGIVYIGTFKACPAVTMAVSSLLVVCFIAALLLFWRITANNGQRDPVTST
jgi:hypothetical protein